MGPSASLRISNWKPMPRNRSARNKLRALRLRAVCAAPYFGCHRRVPTPVLSHATKSFRPQQIAGARVCAASLSEMSNPADSDRVPCLGWSVAATGLLRFSLAGSVRTAQARAPLLTIEVRAISRADGEKNALEHRSIFDTLSIFVPLTKRPCRGSYDEEGHPPGIQ